MTQIVAGHCNATLDQLAIALSRLKQAMLETYARQQDLPVETRYTNYSDYVVVTCSETEDLRLLSTLHTAGCTDLHVYTDDRATEDLVSSGTYGYFRVCKGVFNP